MGQFRASLDTSSFSSERRIYWKLRSQIECGMLKAGEKLLSTRAMAAELCVSRTTVTAAYEQLAAEGFVVTSAGKAARVASILRVASLSPQSAIDQLEVQTRLSIYGQSVAAIDLYRRESPEARIDFKYGSMTWHHFPLQKWLRLYRDEAVSRQPSLYYAQPEGEERLRNALRGYLSWTRGIMCSSAQILIVHGSQQGIDLCARLLLDPGDAFVFEEPGYPMARYCFEATGAKALPIPVDTSGILVDELPVHDRVRLAYITPSHQFPLGGVLSVARRQALLAWAQESNAWIIEDDYGGEFRYGQHPIEAMRAMDANDRVIYVGSFSKALSPQLRLGYLVLPHALAQAFRHAKLISDRHSTLWDQHVLASFIENGGYERHVRRLRRENERRRDTLLEAVKKYLPGRGEILGMAAGSHGVLQLPELCAKDEFALQAAALAAGVGVYPLGPLFSPGLNTDDRSAGLVLGYADLAVEAIDEGIRLLATVIRDYITAGEKR